MYKNIFNIRLCLHENDGAQLHSGSNLWNVRRYKKRSSFQNGRIRF